jgi:hypothetical protein
MQDNPEYASFKQLLEAPQEEAKELMRERFPYPRFVDCNQHGSQVKFKKQNTTSSRKQKKLLSRLLSLSLSLPLSLTHSLLAYYSFLQGINT